MERGLEEVDRVEDLDLDEGADCLRMAFMTRRRETGVIPWILFATPCG